VAIAVGAVVSRVVSFLSRGDCADPCDGPAIIGIGLAFTMPFSLWLLSRPLLVFWPVAEGSGPVSWAYRFEGRGLRRRLVWESDRAGPLRVRSCERRWDSDGTAAVRCWGPTLSGFVNAGRKLTRRVQGVRATPR
jgi:hypothetical protein